MTYYLKTNVGMVFLKLHVNYPWESELKESLSVQSQLSSHLDYIPKPLYTTDNMSFFITTDGTIASLYTFIDGENYVSLNACEVLGLMGGVYKQNLSCRSVYVYKLYAGDIVSALKSSTLCVKSSALKHYLAKNRDVYTEYFKEYERLYNVVTQTKIPLYLTHGDIAKNMMKSSDGRLYIIDWDRIRLAPPELDLHEFVCRDTDITALNCIAQNIGLEWRFEHDFHNYFVLNDLYYYLRNLMRSDNDVLDTDDISGYQDCVDTLEQKLL